MEYTVLNTIKTPADVKKLNTTETQTLCSEIRDCIIETVSKNGGHLASNLGAVELTVALHKTFNSPEDSIIFDVGHQCYTHKLLTGRFDRFNTLRQENGISGFLKPCESEHDAFITGHSSNSISAAYGIYKAKKLTGQNGTAVAVIGDGAMTGGMAYEALNNAGSGKSNFIIVLNDNKMSISRNVGALSRSLTKMRNKPRYHHFKFALSNFLQNIPIIGKCLNKAVFSIKETFKSIIYKNNVFSALGFNYLGPVDGHNIEAMVSLFKIAQSYSRPSIVHVITTKGKGYSYAENSPKNYHGVSPFDIEEGVGNSNTCFSDIAGQTLCTLAENDGAVCAITAAMTSGTGLSDFARQYKNRFFDVGIAEQHAVTFAAGLRKGGMKPYFAVYSSFLQRAYDQIIHDCAIDNLPICLLIDRAGIVGEDGETHQGLFDISFLTSIPNVEIYSPSHYNELEYLIKKSSINQNITAIRYPRGCEKPIGEDIDYKNDFTVLRGNSKKALITYGRLFSNAYDAKAFAPDINIIKLNKIYPLSDELIDAVKNYDEIHFFEESIQNGGIAEHLLAKLNNSGYNGNYSIHAISNKFVPAASVASAMKTNGLDTDSMLRCFNG